MCSASTRVGGRHLTTWRGVSLPQSGHQYPRAARPRAPLGPAPQTRNDARSERARFGRGPRFVFPQPLPFRNLDTIYTYAPLLTSGLQRLVEPARHCCLRPARALAHRRVVRATAAQHDLAQATHGSRNWRRHALELRLRPLLVPQPQFPDLPRGPICPAQCRRAGGRRTCSGADRPPRASRDCTPGRTRAPSHRLEERLRQSRCVCAGSAQHSHRSNAADPSSLTPATAEQASRGE